MSAATHEIFDNAKFRAQYHRICALYCGPNNALLRRWRSRGPDASGIRAMAHLERWAHREVYSLERRASWASGFATFEDRVAAIGATYREGCLTRQQAA